MATEHDTSTTTDPEADDLGEAGKRALDAERRARRDAERRERELRARVEELETAELRRDVAAEKGLTAEQARRLTGSTREELEADADDLLAAFGSTSKAPPSAKPRPELRGGTDPSDMPEDVSGLADRIMGRGI
ncbi:MAG: hypothetical protein M5U14_22210 [Acidimicrobiia bacterium]|nr:hypothetical protein [Acidimicrobiia bacterium]